MHLQQVSSSYNECKVILLAKFRFRIKQQIIELKSYQFSMTAYILAILLYLITRTTSASVPVTWTSSYYFVTGRYSYVPTPMTPYLSETVVVPYATALSAPPTRNVALGIINFNFDLTDSNLFLYMIVQGIGQGGFQFAIYANSYTYFLGPMRISYITVDPAFIYPFSITCFVVSQSTTYSVPYPKIQGPFSISYYVNFTQSTGVVLDLTHDNAMLAFQHMFDLYNVSQGCFNQDIQFTVYNQSFYQVTISTQCYLQMDTFGFSRIIYDKTAIEALGYCYFTYGQLFSYNGNTSPLTITFSPYIGSNFMMGFKSFAISSKSKAVFSSVLGTTTTASTGVAFDQLTFMYWSFKMRVCPTGYPYFQVATLLCFDVCPDGTYPNNTIYTCPPCNYTCLTCSAFNVCTNCNLTTNRYQNGTACPPNAGYFDNNTAIAVLCSSVIPQCGTCDSATNCLTCQTGYYVSGSTTCTLCNTSIPNCASCTIPSQCSACIVGYAVGAGNTSCVIACTDPNCNTCSPVSVCSLCNSGYHVSSGACVTQCGDNITAGTEQCDDGNNVDGDGCNADCTIGNNNNCPAAAPYIDPLNSTCVSACPNGYIANTTTFTCLSCDFSCLTCATATTLCTTCSSSANRNINGTSCLPMPGFFQNNTAIAPPCVAPCLTCTSAVSCSTCTIGTYLSSTACLSCSSAIANCIQCAGLPPVCSNCSTGYILNGTTCVLIPCVDPNCASCPTNNSVCSLCNTGYHLSAATCITQCGDNITAGTEQCDDGNNVDGDGCNADCTIGNNNGCPATAPYIDPTSLLCSSTCPNGFFPNSTTYTCPPCDFSCLTCQTTSTTCLTCSASNNRILNGTSCLPMPGFYQNNVAVAPACVSPCATCSSLTTCITCIVGTYLSGSTCNDCHNAITNCSQCSGSTPTCSNCDPGYIVNTTTNACDVVPCIDINCISCPSTTSICEICNSNGWYLSGIICVSHCGDNILVGTEQCDDGNNVDGDGCNADCTIGNNNGCPAATPYMDPISQACVAICPNAYYNDPTTYSCPSCDFSCLTCQNTSTTCLTCSAADNRIINGSSCLPMPGFYQNGASVAPPCVTPCATCASLTVCITCVVGTYLTGSTCNDCHNAITNCSQCSGATPTCSNCDPGYIVNSTTNLCDVVPCNNINCLSCPSSMAICVQCRAGYQVVSGSCQTVCGDFVLMPQQQCDDGNSVSNDGCSSDCTVQTDFTCEMSASHPLGSACYYIGILNVTTVQISKIPSQNTVQIQLGIYPSNLDMWNNVDFMQMIQLQCAVPISGYNVVRSSNGTVTIDVQYAANIQGQPLNITIDPSNTGNPIFSRTQTVFSNILVVPYDNQAANFYPDDVYKLQAITAKVATATGVLSVAMFMLGIISGKMIGVQMMAVVQISFFSLVSLSELNPCFAALSNLYLVNGYNQLHKTQLQDPLTPIPPKGIGMFSRFAQNFNFTAALVLIPLLVALIAFILSKTAMKTNEKVVKVYQRALGQYTFMGLMFGSYMISVAFALQVMFGMKNMSDLIGKISLVESAIFLLMLCGYFVFIILKPNFFGQFTNEFKKDKISSKFYNLMIIERILIGAGLILLLKVNLEGAAPLAIFALTAIFILVKSPYIKRLHNFRQIANMGIGIIVEGIYIAYKLTSAQTRNTSKIFFYLPIIVCALLIVCVVYNTVALLHSIYQFIKQLKYNPEQIEKEQLQFLAKQRKLALDPLSPLSPHSQLNNSSFALNQSGLITANALRNPLNLDDIKKSVRVNANPTNLESPTNSATNSERLRQIRNQLKLHINGNNQKVQNVAKLQNNENILNPNIQDMEFGDSINLMKNQQVDPKILDQYDAI